ncbi:hypothetical protein Pyn_32590 [Prunus yedoensis var. nudiflora]|uniref:Uncharacterized protein n=1 Tax=Prunus yedoensis var. nudiflora TaxID=2094558 RepID=A0A314Z0W6_PRUYE|nr:hypothetical protein Pyn_32590 [Prunus yedoensis var. nudiflora]
MIAGSKLRVCYARVPKGMKGRACRRVLKAKGVAEGTKLACRKGCRRQRDAKYTKLACRKAMCLGTGVPKVFRHGAALHDRTSRWTGLNPLHAREQPSLNFQGNKP